MIEAIIAYDGFTIKGHADYAENGKDIVCSAVSAIAQTTALGLRTFCDATCVLLPGDIGVLVRKPDMFSTVLIQSMLLGLKEIQAEYPEHIQIKEVFTWQTEQEDSK